MINKIYFENKLILKNKELKEYDSRVLGISGENEQEVLIFRFEDGFVDGTCYLELQFPNCDKGFIELEKDVDNECYKLEVKNSLLKDKGVIKMQLKIAQDTAIWKSKDFEMHVLEAINATETIKVDYPDFIATYESRMNKITKDLSEQVNESIAEALANPRFTTFEVNDNMELVQNNEYKPKNCDFSINEIGEMEVEINE